MIKLFKLATLSVPLLVSAVAQTTTTYPIGPYTCVSENDCSTYTPGEASGFSWAFIPGLVISPATGYWTQGYVQDRAILNLYNWSTGVGVATTYLCAPSGDPTVASQSWTQVPNPNAPGIVVTSTCLFGVLASPSAGQQPVLLPGASMSYVLYAHGFKVFGRYGGIRWSIDTPSVASITQ